MKKVSKLSEKPARIPETRQSQWDDAISQYLRDVERLNSESARSHRFAMLTQQLLGVEPNFAESYGAGIERFIKIRQKDRILKGRVDNLFGNVIIEFESNIPKKLSEAKSQLEQYTAILWSQELPDRRNPYLCIATDGVHFYTFSPKLSDVTAMDVRPVDVQLSPLEESDWNKLKPDEVYYWLDRYFLRREVLRPNSERMVADFGAKSHAFQTTTHALLSLWRQIKDQSAFAVIYESWEKYLRIVYGSEVAGDELFVKHTYLATLAKLMAWKRLTDSQSLPDDEQIKHMLEGRLFKALGIENFIEEDFFSWLARGRAVKTAVGIVRWLFSLLQNYNLSELSEDVLKSLYQELVDPETRHDLGEFYTPDWLAHRIVRKLLDANPRGAMLDPACGSGTFLYLAIREKRERLGDSLETLRHIFESVYGADIHPLAVIVAKTNYILALGDLVKRRRGPVNIPIYLTDTIKLPERVLEPGMAMTPGSLAPQLPGYRVQLDGYVIHLPEPLLKDLALYDQAIELAKEFARQNKGQTISLEPFRNFLIAQRFPSVAGNDALTQALFAIAETLKHFIDTDRDTIWAFVLKNAYKPLFFKRKFDFVIGNPPWIAFRYMEPKYQEFLKEQITKEYRLLTGRGELITHLEVATLFLVRAADLYLKLGGTIAFVLPKSLFSADQHDGLRRRSFRFSEQIKYNLRYREIWDCENVNPLFNVPACVLVADKGEFDEAEYPVAGQIIGGKLNRKNASLLEAQGLTSKDVEFSLHTRGKRSFWATGTSAGPQAASYYKTRFAQGATIVPRSFWFVRVKPSPLGFNPDLPPLETAQRAIEEAKEPYKDVRFEGQVETKFLYATLLSTDLLPFGHFDYRLVVLPIESEGDRYRLIDASEARQRGFLNLARWVEKVEEEWVRLRSTKAERSTALDWLDYRKKLTVQNPQAKYRVLYNTSGTFLTAAIVEDERLEFEINGQHIVAQSFAAESVTYHYETTIKDEAYYVAAILNAPTIDKLVKPMQARGLWGPRHFHKKVLELPIPKFDVDNPIHRRLAELGEECSARVTQWLAGGGAGQVKSIGRLRGMAREMLKDELAEIDGLVRQILG